MSHQWQYKCKPSRSHCSSATTPKAGKRAGTPCARTLHCRPCAALDSDGKSLHLDFVFGDVVNKEDGGKQTPTLYPLDGQQRLTTLFLLHCYLAWHQPQSSASAQPWHAFQYATRPARAFCQFRPNVGPAWMLSRLQHGCATNPTTCPPGSTTPPFKACWWCWMPAPALPRSTQRTPACRLATADRPVNPAIRFLLLPVAAQKLDNTLYVKMNSRGRP